MSHIPERKEKDCLNCGTIVTGRYCQQCGQENVVPKETFWHMVTHFFYDVTHFDSKFFHTFHHLLFRPGLLTRAYMQGKRASYLHPIKMYVFSSTVFFLLFFSFFLPDTNFKNSLDEPLDPAERKEAIMQMEKKILTDSMNTRLKLALQHAKDSSYIFSEKDYYEFQEHEGINLVPGKYASMKEYDSLQKLKPKKQRDGWIKKRLIRVETNINNAAAVDPEGTLKRFINSLLHRLPYMLFISLPLFALILRLVYIRQRKQYYFADHGVFTIHLYIFTFFILLLVFLMDELKGLLHENVTGWGILILFLVLFFYLYKAMKNFYGQKRGKTFFKFLLVAFFSFLMMLILFMFFIFFSAFTF